jgi:hypothetical protein
MSGDKRSVATDALETLGNKIDAYQKRDAIHLAVEPVEAECMLYPGQEIGLLPDGRASKNASKMLGIVDPFLTSNVYPGDRFWLIVFPRKITSLRHVWSHPDFTEEPEVGVTKTASISISVKWMEEFAARHDMTSADMIGAGMRYLDTGDYLVDGGKLEGESVPEEYWDHFEKITGRKDKPEWTSFFSCSC